MFLYNTYFQNALIPFTRKSEIQNFRQTLKKKTQTAEHFTSEIILNADVMYL